MKNTRLECGDHTGAMRGNRYLPGALALLALLVGVSALQAQDSVTITPRTRNYWTGAKTITNGQVTVTGSHFVEVSGGDHTNVTFTLSPGAGLDQTNISNVTITPVPLTNNGIMTLRFQAKGTLATGYFPLIINAFTNDGVSITNLLTSTSGPQLIVAHQWGQTNTNSTGNWSDPTKWTTGVSPTSGDSVYMDHTTLGPWTNVVDTSFAIKDLVYLGDADDNGGALNVHTIISPGVTLSVLGTNGFIVGRKAQSAQRPYYRFSGDSMIVSNENANFSILDGGANATRFLTVNMQDLNNLTVKVKRMGVGDTSMQDNSALGAQRVGLSLARTNVIIALQADDYSALDFNTSIQFNRQREGANNGGIATDAFNLGISNVIYADSLGVGRCGAVGSGSSAFSVFGYQMRFNPLHQTNFGPFASALFRNTNGTDRMSLVAVGVDSGTQSLGSLRGVLDLRGGKIDMLVNQIWIARNRTNSGGNDVLGGFYFDNGTVDANIVRVGYCAFTNGVSLLIGYLSTETNGTLTVNNELNLGYTPSDITGFENSMAAVSGQVRVNNGGRMHINQITVGQFSTNNQVTVNNGGRLVLSNSIATASTKLARLTAAGGRITLSPNGNPRIYASNLVATAASPIDIDSLSGLPGFPDVFTTTNVPLIVYDTAVSPSFWAGGTGPGISVAVYNDVANKTIRAVLSAGTPKTLIWKDYTGDHAWNTSSKNWLDVNTGIHTNFSSLDVVTFDDTGYPNILVTDAIVASQTGGGTIVSNNTVNYTFTSSGGGLFTGGALMNKLGTGSLTIDLATEFTISVSEGSLTNTVSGILGGVTTSTNTTFVNSGNLLAALNSSGTAVNHGTITTGLTVQNGGNTTNALGTINGGVTVSGTNSLLVNNATLAATTVTVNSGSTLVNNSVINATTGITINDGATLIDNVSEVINNSPGSMNVGPSQLVIKTGATFIPGGGSFISTKVTEYPQFTARPSGGLNFESGSTIYFKINMANPRTNNLVLANQLQFGPSPGSTGLPRGFNGCILKLQNVGATPFAAGQTFNLFQYYQGGDIICTTNTATNSFPVIDPPSPGPGLRWSLNELYYKGNIKVVSLSDPAYNFQLAVPGISTLDGTNYITLSWPEANKGGWVQHLSTALTNGMNATNWSYEPNSSFNTTIIITNRATPGAEFYRFVYP